MVVDVLVGRGVQVDVWVLVGVTVGVQLGVGVELAVWVKVGVLVSWGVLVGVTIGVWVEVGVLVGRGVLVGSGVLVGLGVLVGWGALAGLERGVLVGFSAVGVWKSTVSRNPSASPTASCAEEQLPLVQKGRPGQQPRSQHSQVRALAQVVDARLRREGQRKTLALQRPDDFVVDPAGLQYPSFTLRPPGGWRRAPGSPRPIRRVSEHRLKG